MLFCPYLPKFSFMLCTDAYYLCKQRPGPALTEPGPPGSSHVITAHYLSTSLSPSLKQGRVGAESCGSRPELRLSWICGSGLGFQAERQSSCGLFGLFLCVCGCVCAGVCVFLDLFKPELILQRAAEMWDVWSACVYVGGAPERADFLFSFRLQHSS